MSGYWRQGNRKQKPLPTPYSGKSTFVPFMHFPPSISVAKGRGRRRKKKKEEKEGNWNAVCDPTDTDTGMGWDGMEVTKDVWTW